MRKVPCECPGEARGNGTHTTTTFCCFLGECFLAGAGGKCNFIDFVEEEDEREVVQSFRVISSWSSLNSFNGVPDMSLHRCDTLIDG